MDEVEVESKVS